MRRPFAQMKRRERTGVSSIGGSLVIGGGGPPVSAAWQLSFTSDVL